MTGTERIVLYGIVAAVVVYFINAYTTEAQTAATAAASAANDSSIAGQATSLIDDFGGLI